MKNYLLWALVFITVLSLVNSVYWRNSFYQEKKECAIAKSNVNALLSDVEHYKSSDSLNCARVEALQFTESEYKKLLSSQASELERLKIKNRSLSQALSVATSSSATVTAVVHDTVVMRDSILLPIKCFDYEDSYLSLHGCVNDKFVGEIQLRDTLFITESVKYKRFLGFLWKTKKVKDRKWDVISKNPYTNFSQFNVVQVIY